MSADARRHSELVGSIENANHEARTFRLCTGAGGGQAGGSGWQAAEYRLYVRGRPRIWGRWLLWSQARQDTEPRPDGKERRPVHERALAVGHLHAIAVCADDRGVRLAEKRYGSATGRCAADRSAR